MSTSALISLSMLDEEGLDLDGLDSSTESDSEVLEAEMEMLEAEEQLDDLEASAEGMEEIQEELTQESANGGVSRDAAKWLALACKNAMGPHTRVVIGDKELEVNKPPVLSLESYGGSDTSEDATKLTMESIGATIKKIWAAIKSAVVRVVNAVREFFSRIFKGAKGVKADLEDAKAKVSAKDTYEDVKVPGIASRLHVGGKVEPAVVKLGVTEMANAGTSVYHDYLDAASEYYVEVANRLVDASNGKADADAVLTAAVAKNKQASDTLASVQKKHSKALPGGKRLVYTTAAESNNTSGSTKLGRLSVEDAGGKKPTEGQVVKGGSHKDNLISILDEAIKLINTFEKRKSNVEQMQKSRDDAIKAGDALTKASDKNWFAEKWTQAKVQSVLRLTNVNLSQSLTSYTSYCFKVARAASVYAKAFV